MRVSDTSRPCTGFDSLKVRRSLPDGLINKLVERAILVARVDEPFYTVADQIIRRPAKRGGPSRIYVDDLSAEIGHNEKILGELPDPVPFLGRLTINFLTNQTL